jgi:phage gp29-like protein
MAKKTKAQTPQPRVSFPLVVLPKDNSKQTLPLYKMAKDAAESIYAPTRKPLYDLYREIVLDTHVSSVMDKRLMAITNVTWTLTVDGEPVEAAKDFLKSSTFEKMLKWIIEAKLYGHSLIEFHSPTDIELVPREYVSPIHQMVFPDPYQLSEGYDYTKPPFSNKVFEIGDKEDLGLLYKIAPYVLLKKGDISDWASYNEVFGSPLRVGKYDPNIPGNESAVANALKKMGNLAYAALPIGSDFNYVESSKAGTGNTIYEQFADFCNKEISKCIVGQTMTSEDGGSLSQAKVHLEVQDQVNLSDRSSVEKSLNEDFLPILRNSGMPIPDKARFHVMEEDETLTKKERLEMDLLIHDKVGRLKKDYFQSEYNVEFDESAEPVETLHATSNVPVSSSVVENQPKNANPVQNANKTAPNTKKPTQANLSDCHAELVEAYPEPTLWENFSDGITTRLSRVFKDALKSIYDTFSQSEPVEDRNYLNPELFNYTANRLLKAVDKGFGKVNYGDPSEELLFQLRRSAVFFSANKTITQVEELTDLLITPEGTIRQFSEFSRLARPVLQKYNLNWLRTEYNAAIASARAAKDYKKAQEDIEIYPNLKYMPSVSADPRDSHKKFYGLILPVNDPFWIHGLPPSDWNCKCWTQQTDEEVTPAPTDYEIPKGVFANNPAVSGELFSKDHPYFQAVGLVSEEQINEIVEEYLKPKS